MASLSMVYGLSLVGASAAVMGAAFMGGNMNPIGETGSSDSVPQEETPEESDR